MLGENSSCSCSIEIADAFRGPAVSAKRMECVSSRFVPIPFRSNLNGTDAAYHAGDFAFSSSPIIFAALGSQACPSIGKDTIEGVKKFLRGRARLMQLQH